MALNPMIPQGTLNRVRGSIVIPDFPSLNVTASYLGRGGISMAKEGAATLQLPQMTGTVTSPEPYQLVNVTVNLLRTQSIAAAYEAQLALLSVIGQFNVIPDAVTLPTYTVYNGSIGGLREMSFGGEDAGYVITLQGYIIINNNLFNQV